MPRPLAIRYRKSARCSATPPGGPQRSGGHRRRLPRAPGTARHEPVLRGRLPAGTALLPPRRRRLHSPDHPGSPPTSPIRATRVPAPRREAGHLPREPALATHGPRCSDRAGPTARTANLQARGVSAAPWSRDHSRAALKLPCSASIRLSHMACSGPRSASPPASARERK